jgi:uncharacterized protein YprB with RNaseH-like and TPR domain
MRDLAARLRAIVQADRSRERESVSADLPGLEDAELRVSGGRSDALAEYFGGRWQAASSSGACLVIDRTWDPFRSHGRRRIHECEIAPSSPVGLFDHRIAEVPDWASKLVFFDIETTGLSGGAGTIAFLAGCGWFGPDGFTVRQFLLTGPSGERALLEQLEAVFDAASVLVTYNGRTFDVPTMEMRWAFHRRSAPTDDLPHFDMLPVARRLWGFRGSRRVDRQAEATSCSLSTLERSVLQFYRTDDVPGFEIPARYFHFVRTGDATVIDGVLEHNRHDLVSLAVLTAHALWLAETGPDGCREPCELLGLGRCYARAGDLGRAEEALARAASSDDEAIRGHALAFLADLQRKDGRVDEAARSWQRILDGSAGELLSHERRAAESLAIYHEHRAKDPEAARRYAESLRGALSGESTRRRGQVDHRLARLDRKIARTHERGGPSAAPLLEKPFAD